MSYVPRRRRFAATLALTVSAACAAQTFSALSGCSSAPPVEARARDVATPFPHSSSAASSRVVGSPAAAGFTAIQGLDTARRSSLNPQTPHFDWNVPTSTPVRAAPLNYGAFVVPAPTDLSVFAVDNYKPSTITAPGITAATAPTSIANWASLTAAQQTEAEQSTVFVLTNLYAPTPTLLGWSNSATVSYTKDSFGLSWMLSSLDAANLQLYAISQAGILFCWQLPLPQSSAGYAPSQVGALATCSGWSTAGKNVGGKVTYSSPYPVWTNGADVYEMYWGDDVGNLNCLQGGATSGDAGAGKAPSPCSKTFASGSVSLGLPQALGYAVVDPVTTSPGSAVENDVFVGSQYGTMYRIDDVQQPTLSFTSSAFCASTGQVGVCPTTNTADYAIYAGVSIDGSSNKAYWASHGTLYEAPIVGSGANGAWVTSDVKSLPLFTSTAGSPIFSMFIDVTPSTHFAYVAANEHLYKVPIPFSGTTVYSTPLYRHADANVPQSIVVSSTTTVSVPSGSEPLGSGLAWDGLLYLSSGYGSTLAGGSVGAPVSSGTLTPTLSGGLEQYGCTGSAASPYLSGVTPGYGALSETGAILDYEGGNAYFGYDTGGATPTGGFVQYPPASTNPAAWTCPSPTTLGSACGSTTACVGAPPIGKCVNDSDCSGATPYCDIFPDTSFGTCVACRTDQQCPQPTGAFEVCDTNNAAYACVPTARCKTSSNCTNTTDDPDYATSLTQCNTTVGTTQYGLCGLCVSNAACAAFTSTPVCDQKNAASSAFGTCVECTSDTDCAANDEYENAGLTHCDQNPGSPNFDHCAACATSGQCASGQVCDTTTPSASTTYFDTCVACDSASAASCAGQVCDTVLGDATYDQCVSACTPAGSSNAPANHCGVTAPVCAASGGCVQCTTNAQCPGNAGNAALVCNAGFVCECEASSDCPGGAASGATCQNNVCVP